ncbi:MAG: hypothetical protein R2940_04415 [Syntrophotaleaceae bacterium]
MHRIQSGEIDQSGWSTAESTRGGFSVQLPGKFNDFTIEMLANDGTPIFNHTVGAITAEGVKFGASCIISDKYKSQKDSVNLFTDSIKETSRFFEKSLVRYQGLEGAEVHCGNGVTNAYFRVFQDEHKLYFLIVDYPPVFEKEMLAHAMKFLHSFKINKQTN